MILLETTQTTQKSPKHHHTAYIIIGILIALIGLLEISNRPQMKPEFEKLEIKINGPRKKIWDTLTDLNNYFNWNSVVPHGRGEIIKGNTLVVSIKLPGKKARFGNCLVNEVVPQHYFILSRKMAFKWLLYMEHAFIIEALNESAHQFKFTQTLKISGLLKPLLKSPLKLAWDRFNQMNIDLKNHLNKL